MSSDLWRRIGLTIGALLVVRLGTFISIPGINPQTWDQIFRQQSSGVLGAFDWLAGGAIGCLSIFALSIMPFINASLLMQLASIVSRRLRALPKQGERGRRRFDAYTLALTIGLAVGALYLAFLYLLPEILIARWSLPFYLGGTSLLIVVCAILDLQAQLKQPRQEAWEAK